MKNPFLFYKLAMHAYYHNMQQMCECISFVFGICFCRIFESTARCMNRNDCKKMIVHKLQKYAAETSKNSAMQHEKQIEGISIIKTKTKKCIQSWTI